MTQVSVSDARPRASAGSTSDNASRREAQILAAATVLMSRKGLAFSTRELADAVGVSQPLVYRYFPSKAVLLDRVFDEIYVKRWDASWTGILRDRSVPLVERLVRYLRSYTAAILDEAWIRIFLASAIEEPAIAQRYLRLLHETTLTEILDELVHDYGEGRDRSPQFDDLARELIWSFHSSFFYLGVRKFVYRLPIPEPLAPLIQLKVDVFLAGMRSAGFAGIDRRSGGEGAACAG
jgi:AcrR family transcriptional regulator